MGARALNEIEQTIAETRAHIEIQRDIVQKYNDGGQITDAALAEGILRALKKSLEILQERRRIAVEELRRPRATSKPAPPEKARRRSGS
jgi:hypothetical protein